MAKRSEKVFQLTPGTKRSLGTWCRIASFSKLEIGWGSATSTHFTENAQIALSEEDARALTRFLVEHYPLEALAGIPGD